MTKNKEFISKTDSKAPVRSWTPSSNSASLYPDFNPLAVEELINTDPVARAALQHFVDKVLEGDWAVLDRLTRKYNRTKEDELNFKFYFDSEIIAKIARSAKLFNSAFLEIVSLSDGRPKALNVMDTYLIEPITSPNGDVISFKSKLPNPSTGVYPTWTKDEMIWFKFGDRSLGYPPMDMRALQQNLLMKYFIRRFVSWLWETGQYRLSFNFGSADNKVVDDFIAYNSKNDSDFKMPFISKGELEAKVLRDMKEQSDLIKMLEYLDGQTLILMRIPPIDAGIPDASGRSNSDAQSNNLNTHITGFKKVFAGTVNKDLFPKIGFGTQMLVFAPNDRFQEKQVIDNVNIMKNMGMKGSIIKEYMTDKGFVFDEDEFFEPLLEVGTTGTTKDINTMPSRFKGEGTGLNKVGTGEQSSTRPDQLIKKTIQFPEPKVQPQPSWVI